MPCTQSNADILNEVIVETSTRLNFAKELELKRPQNNLLMTLPVHKNCIDYLQSFPKNQMFQNRCILDTSMKSVPNLDEVGWLILTIIINLGFPETETIKLSNDTRLLKGTDNEGDRQTMVSHRGLTTA